MASLSHPFVLRVFGITRLPKHIGILMELGSGHLQVPTSLSPTTLAQAIDVCTAVQHLHSKGLVHHDIKPQNIVWVNSQVKLADFGSSRSVDNYTSTLQITPKYTPPEAFDKIYSPAFDVYSLGILFYEMFANRLAFEHMGVLQVVMAKQKKHSFSFPDGFPKSISSLINKCLSVNPSERPSIKDVLKELNEINRVESSIPPIQPVQLTVFFKISKQTLTLKLRQDETIEAIKEMLYQREHSLSPSRLIWTGKVLEDERSLQDYGIQNNSTIYVQPLLCISQLLTVLTETGSRIELCLGEFGDTVAHIKDKIHEKKGIPVSTQCIKDGDGVILGDHVFINPSEAYTRGGKFVDVFDKTLIQDYRHTDVLHLGVLLPKVQQRSRGIPSNADLSPYHSLPVQVVPFQFQFYTPDSSAICLAGSFSAWHVIPMVYDDHDHCHRLVLNILTGESHRFKFTDGKQWFLGKYDTATDEHGNTVNILTL
ncbi:hypothetical protein GEMRC1_006391 [Eukaryota sp. GEM-RC1]